MATVTKSELRDMLLYREQLAIHKVSKPKRAEIQRYKYASLAESFLRDYSKFKEFLDTFDKNQCFTLISSRFSYNYKCKDNTIILFDSFTITLLQIDNNLFIYLIAKYSLT